MKKADILISEIGLEKKYYNLLRISGIDNLEEFEIAIKDDKYIRGIGIEGKKVLLKTYKNFLLGKIKIKRTKLSDDVKEIRISELDLNKRVKNALIRSNKIKTINDLAYLVDRNLFQEIKGLSKEEMDNIKSIYNNLLKDCSSVKRYFSEEERTIIKSIKDHCLEEYKLPTRYINSLNQNGINTIEGLANLIIDDDYSRIRNIGEMGRIELIEIFNRIIKVNIKNQKR